MSDSPLLLTRDKFREAVFKRDGYSCVVCNVQGKPGFIDAHHILERRLWPDGGYYLNNGATVCSAHHMACEATDISVEEIRIFAGVTKKIIPPHLYDDVTYDKWGNIVLPNGQRMKGELFFDESVQKVLAGHMHEFTDYVKYPRTYHLPWSQNLTNDDRMMENTTTFENRRVIVTEKMDGENTTLYKDYIHARSIDGRSHPSRDWVKQFHASIAHDIPVGWRICGENLFAEHSIHYDRLSSYFLGFSIWNERNICLSWDETVEWFEILGIIPVPTMYDGIYDEEKIKNIMLKGIWNWDRIEGFVIRTADEYSYGAFKNCVGKFVRKDHVQTVKHWMFGQQMKVNGLL